MSSEEFLREHLQQCQSRIAALEAENAALKRSCVLITPELLRYLEQMPEPVRTFFRDYVEQAEKLKSERVGEVIAEGWILKNGTVNGHRNVGWNPDSFTTLKPTAMLVEAMTVSIIKRKEP